MPGQEAKYGYPFEFFFNRKIYCVFSLESPHPGDSNENTQYTIFQYKKKITRNIPDTIMTAAMVFFVRDS